MIRPNYTTKQMSDRTDSLSQDLPSLVSSRRTVLKFTGAATLINISLTSTVSATSTADDPDAVDVPLVHEQLWLSDRPEFSDAPVHTQLWFPDRPDITTPPIHEQSWVPDRPVISEEPIHVEVWGDAEDDPSEAALQLQLEAIENVTIDESFSLDLTIEETAGIIAETVTVTLTVTSPTGDPVYEATITVGEVDAQAVVTFGADENTPEIGPFETDGEHEVVVGASSDNAQPETITEPFIVDGAPGSDPNPEPSVDNYADQDGVVRIGGVLDATGDYGDGVIGIDVTLQVINAYSSGEPV